MDFNLFGNLNLTTAIQVHAVYYDGWGFVDWNMCVCVLAGGTTFQEDAAVTLVVKVNVQVNE